jgi:membrane protease YdiL (CAAX protease family)
VIAAASVVCLAWILLFRIRRGPFWIVLALAAAAMLAVAVMRTPRHQDVLLAHQGIVVLGVGSAVALVLAFIALGPLARRIPWLYRGVLEAYARPQSLRNVATFFLLLVAGTAEELFWRGFVQGRLAQAYGERRSFRLTLAGYVLVHLLTLNVALAGAALICGSVWGWFRLRTGSIVPSVISHLTWLLIMYYAFPL